jgi:hypothetical protein
METSKRRATFFIQHAQFRKLTRVSAATNEWKTGPVFSVVIDTEMAIARASSGKFKLIGDPAEAGATLEHVAS